VIPAHPRIDVVVPLFNKEDVVVRAIESVANQTFTDWRLTIIDDGSEDGGVARIRPFLADERIRLVQQSNAGPGAARNEGLRQATAPYVTFLDADDEWLPEFLERCMVALDANPDCRLVATSWYWSEQRTDMSARHAACGLASGTWACTADIPHQALKDRIDSMHSSAVVVSRSVAVELGGFYQRDRCTYGEDSYLWAAVVLREHIVRINEPLMWFHTDASSLSVGRTTPYTVPPILTESGPFVASIPKSLLPMARRYLRWYSLWVVERLAREGAPLRGFRMAATTPRSADMDLSVAGQVHFSLAMLRRVARGTLNRVSAQHRR
jgi:hypothetical protein